MRRGEGTQGSFPGLLVMVGERRELMVNKWLLQEKSFAYFRYALVCVQPLFYAYRHLQGFSMLAHNCLPTVVLRRMPLQT